MDPRLWRQSYGVYHFVLRHMGPPNGRSFPDLHGRHGSIEVFGEKIGDTMSVMITNKRLEQMRYWKDMDNYPVDDDEIVAMAIEILSSRKFIKKMVEALGITVTP